VPEYILFIEEVNFSPFLDVFILNPDVIFFQEVDVNFSSYRTAIKSGETEYISKTKEWVYTTFLIGRRLKFLGGYDVTFISKTLKKWFWWWSWWGSIPKQNIYNNFSHLNFLVGKSFVNHDFINVASSDYRLVDCFLLRNHSVGVYNSEWIKLFESRNRAARFVFYRSRPFAKELLTEAIVYYKPGLFLAINNPQCMYFDDGLLYARKWVVHVYMTFSSFRMEPFHEYGYWTSEYFPSFSPYLESFLAFDDKNINYFLYYYHYTNFMYILWFFLLYYAIFFYIILFFYFYSKNKFHEVALPIKILSYIYKFAQEYTVVFNAKKKQIRVDKMEFRKEYGLKTTRRRHFESRLLNFLNKYIFSRINIFYWKWLSIDSKHYERFKSGDYKLSYVFVLMSFVLINAILELLILPKNLIYYTHYMYYLWLPRYFKNYLHLNFRNHFSFESWFTSFVTVGREFFDNNAFDAVRNFMHYLNLYRKDEYKKRIREKIIQAYEAKMWGLEVDEEKKEEYINFYFYKIFGDYYPDTDFFNVLMPRIFSRSSYNSDFSFNKIYTNDFAEFFSAYWSKFSFIEFKKRLPRFLFLRYFFSFNFWRLYFYYYYVLYADKLDKADNLLKLYFFYGYTCFIYTYSLWNRIISVIMTKRILIRYFFRHYLFLSYNFLNTFILYKIIFKFFYFIFLFLFIPLFVVLYFFDLLRSYVFYFFNAMKNRMSSFPHYVLVSDRGYSYKFWYNYYIIKFYFVEYNIFSHVFARIFYFFTSVLAFMLFLYVIFSLPIFNDIFFGDKFFKVFYFFSERLDIYVKYFHLNYSLNRWKRFYLRSSVLFNGYFEVFVNYYDRKYAYLSHDINFELMSFFHLRTFAKYDFEYVERFSDILQIMEEKKFKFMGVDFVKLHYWLFPNLPPWWMFFLTHLYLKFIKEPTVFIMPDFYWIHLPVLVTWLKGAGYYSVFPIVMMPIAWFLNNFYALITFNILYWTYNTPLYYIFFFILKGLYSFYLFLVYQCFYSFYYYYYYKLWVNISNYFFTFYMDDIRFGLRKYSVSRFLIAVDLNNILKLVTNSLLFIINNSVIYFIANLYKSLAGFFSVLGFNFVGSTDYFSLNFLPTFRPFSANFYDIVLPSNYDLQEYNSIFSEHVQNRAGKNRRYHLKHHKLNPYLSREKYKLHALEFKVRGFLAYDPYYLSNMALVPHLISYRSNNLLFYILPSLYVFFFLFLFLIASLYIKHSYFLKESRHYYNSATYEWQMFTKRQKRAKLGVDEYYWLYNIRWLRTFEFYWDKCFQDDLFASYRKNEDILGFELVNKLNEMMLQTNSAYALGNTYFKLRRYYFDRYLLFIRDIDYFFKIHSVRKHHLGRRWWFYSKYNFFFPLFEKVKNEANYAIQYTFLNRDYKMDYFWAHFITSYFLREKSNVDYFNFSSHRELHDSIKRSLFKAYAVFEMNQKDFPFDLFEFQFFEPEFFSELYENFWSYDEDKKNNVLRKIIYSRSNVVLLYSALSDAQNAFNALAYDKKINNFFLYLDDINKRYFNGFVDFSLFGFMNAVANVTTNITPNIAKTAVDIDRGDLIGVSYKKSMLLDEFTSTEITESVFASVDYFFSKTKFNNIDMYKVFLKEERVTTNKPVSTWWLILAILPFFVFYIELDSMFKYGRYITPQGTFTDVFQYIVSHLFNERISNRLMWVKYFAGDFINWTKKLKFQVKTAHYRSVAWEVRWIELASFWTGNNAILQQSKLDYSWFLLVLFNDHDGYYKSFSTHFVDFYIRCLLVWRYVFKFFVLLKFIQFCLFVFILHSVMKCFFYLYGFVMFFFYDNVDVEEHQRQRDEFIAFKQKGAFRHLDEELDKHRETVDFIQKYKEQQKKKQKEEQDRRTGRENEAKRDRSTDTDKWVA
jgi:hypothetical protein